MTVGKGITYFTCTNCNRAKARINRQTKSTLCATCIRRLSEGGHIMQKGPAGPGGRGKKKKKGAKRTSNSIPRAPQGDE